MVDERYYRRAIDILKRIDVAEQKKAWQEGETLEAAIDEARSLLSDIRSDEELAKLLDEFRE
jgi:hypothetical protein